MRLIAEMDQLFVIRAQQQNRDAVIGQPAQQAIDLRLRFDVDTPGGIGEQQAARLQREPFAQYDFLLIAARERRDGQVEPAMFKLQRLERRRVERRVRAIAAMHAERGEGEIAG